MVLKIDSITISPKEVFVSFKRNRANVDLTLYLGNAALDDDVRKQFAFLFLDQALGEYDVETYVGAVDVQPNEAVATSSRLPLDAFVKEFLTFKSKFN